MSYRWTRQHEKGSPAALRLILWIALHLGRGSARLILYPITLYFLITAAEQRRASRSFLARVRPGPMHWWHVARHIHCFSATILDRVFLLSGRLETFDIRFHGLDAAMETIGAGHGVILLGSHLGSFEVLRALAAHQSVVGLKVLMYPQHNQSLTRLLETLDPGIADSVIPLGTDNALLKVGESLERGEMVGILGDRSAPGEPVVDCRFFDGVVPFPSGPLRIAAATDAPVVLFFGLYRGGNRYDIHFEILAEHIDIDRRDRKRDIQAWMQRYAERLEYHARRSPYNWFNFYDYWA